MILGLGTDLVAVPRVEGVLTRHRERFLRRVFTPAEQAECFGRSRPVRHFAARLAAKEATMKALGTGWGLGICWQDIEVRSGAATPPTLRLGGAAKRWAEARGVRQAMVSLSHDGDYAIAVVVATD